MRGSTRNAGEAVALASAGGVARPVAAGCAAGNAGGKGGDPSVVSGIVTIVRGQLLFGIVLIIVGLLVGPGGVSLFSK